MYDHYKASSSWKVKMKITELSKQTHVTSKTIRYYEQIGLLPEPQRAANGYRIYEQQDVERLAFIRRCRDLQIPLEEIKKIIGAESQNQDEHQHVDHLIAAQLKRVKQAKIELEALEHTLTHLLNDCDGEQDGQCNIIKNLKKS